jgi:tRNA nucleotidyltransferase (CCA-adding enzyme)
MESEVLNLCEAVRRAGGRAMMVGGSVRDRLLGLQSKDYDLEIYGIQPSILRSLLEETATVNTVGEHFAVYKLVLYRSGERFEIDVSIPRRESKSGRGHRAFIITGDPQMSFEEAARRRDFTINAILYDPLTDEIVDPYGGREDLKKRVLRRVAPDTFVEDSLRVLRAVQLAARFEMTIDAETVALCRGIDLSDLPRERIRGEIEKLLTRAARPSIGLRAALDLGVLDKLFPELRAMDGCPQDKDLHPEGDVFSHTLLCLDEAAKMILDLPKEKQITVMLAALCHDAGKPLTTVVIDGRVLSPGHERAGLDPARSVMKRLGLYTLGGYSVRAQVLALVEHHLRPEEFYDNRDRVSDGDFRRLALKVDIDLLYRLASANAGARGDASSRTGPDWFIERARALGVDKGPPAPLLKGRHLIEAGFDPGPEMGRIIRRVYDLQLDGKVTTIEEALAAARDLA